MAFEFPILRSPVIFATKGLPCTGKSELGMPLGDWATSPVLYIDQFLDALSLERGYTAESPPSPGEAERLHRLSFDALCKAASDYLIWGADRYYNGLVVKSRLSSTFELDRLVHLARESGCEMILIVEFKMKNEYRFRVRLEDKVKSGGQEEWYKPRSWKDIEKAMEDDRADDHDSWDLHLRRLVLDNGDGLPRVARLVLDPFDDLYLDPPAGLTAGSARVIKYLLRGLEVGRDSNKDEEYLFLEGSYVVVQFVEFLRSIAEKRIGAAAAFSGERSNYLCGSRDDYCVFKHWEELPDDNGKSYYCGVCEERVVSGNPAYSCIDCFLLLHKSCAELPASVVAFEGFEDVDFLRNYPDNGGVPRHACKSCIEEGEGFFSPECKGCLFQTHLKCRVLPTILNHECHEHSLGLSLTAEHKCKACGTDRESGRAYECYICSLDYDVECVSQLREVEHEHGGHKHDLKLTYLHPEKEEGYWCEVCFEDMDPQNWFYTCQNCPYYVAHPHCVRLSGGRRIATSSSQS